MKLHSLLVASPLPGLVWAQGQFNYIGTSSSECHAINATQAGTVVQAAALEPANISIPVNIAITDPSGLLVAFLRTENVFSGSIDISQNKARTVSLLNGAFTIETLYNNLPGASLCRIEETCGGLAVFGGGLPISSTVYSSERLGSVVGQPIKTYR
ncbi:uncharacterized protein HMPREF1541_01420 [Cyphellophora europaea CBS 101466]|uniref:Uncharacterized protein n=1 Tax=Cyphellophora europaea (strain CBS 101466) TaxID=1220924 RepID=W2SGU5_CYPE1|nr:uncharacterized protein HMPREF1541_01420 [Cyphellophora europaea CBS 101466]ETN47228.1 hypothetical protein HMPREF1541_01420 [Cyphellophora europaea CBS 101466]